MMGSAPRIAIALGFVGAVGVAGVAWGDGAGSRPVSDAVLAPADGTRVGAFGGHRGLGPLGRVVTGEMKVQTEDGFATVRTDAGVVTSVRAPAVTLERADGGTVTVTATDDTRVARDGRRAEVADLQRGDQVRVTRVDRGDGPVVRSIVALSEEALEQRRARIEAMRERMGERGERRMFRKHRGPDRDRRPEDAGSSETTV